MPGFLLVTQDPVPTANMYNDLTMLAVNRTVSWTKKHSLRSKWNILFDKSPEWISFKPQLGFKVYPCYSCRNMFSSKMTFQDHINRRVAIIKYKCTSCSNTLTFYNRCSFLLHTRKHYSLREGQIDLSRVDIFLLPLELAGFSHHESIPFLYDEEEEFIDDNVYINTQFYNPDDDQAGNQIVTVKPYNLVFHYTDGDKNILLTLKQITSNIPLCRFIPQEAASKPTVMPAVEISKETTLNVIEQVEIKQEVDVDDYTIPVISKIESLSDSSILKRIPTCPECLTQQSMSMYGHFSGSNKPFDAKLSCFVCKFITPTSCSLKAHIRTHTQEPPFVCPECGKAFKEAEVLNTHMADVCFHLVKHIRFRCPAIKCGKLFVLKKSFAGHLVNHMQVIQQCSECSTHFFKDSDFEEHAQTHISCTKVKNYNCTICKGLPVLTEENYDNHVQWHVNNRERCVYIYICKHCRSSFRSTTTYAVHKLRCSKMDKSGFPGVHSNCHFCGQRIFFRDKVVYKTCPTCKQINFSPQTNDRVVAITADKKKSICILCKEEVEEEEKQNHATLCKYNNPVVSVQNLSSTNDTSGSEGLSTEDTNSEKLSTSSYDFESKLRSNDSTSPEKSDESTGKKRKQSGTQSGRSKKSFQSLSEDLIDLQAEEPVSFDGTYYCKLCDYKNTDRTEFHGHIIEHRNISTAYQCMECGECFVVKPSLIKHLTHYHKISDTTSYFMKNDCFDKFAIEELENNLKLVPREHTGPVNENQCSVCLKQCESDAALNIHFRLHGMAFLRKKSK